MTRTHINSRNNRFCLALLSVTLLLSGLCSAQPTVTLSAKSGPPTTDILVSGTGFPASTAVEIYFGITEFALAATNSTGSFSRIQIQVPASTPPGIEWITTVVDVTGEAAQAPFKVQTNWPQFHFGANRDGLNPYENILGPPTVGNLGLLWNYTTGAAVRTSPAVFNGMLYVGSDDGNVYALNATTGAKLWNFTTGGVVESSPAVATGVPNALVYVGSDDDNVYALNAGTGAVVWKFTTGGPVATSPAVVGGVVYVTSADLNLYALNASTGAELWFVPGFIYAVSTSPAVSNGVLYFWFGGERKSLRRGHRRHSNLSVANCRQSRDRRNDCLHPRGRRRDGLRWLR